MHQITPSPSMHIAIGGLMGGLLGAPFITNPSGILASPNPIGFLLVLIGLPLGGVVYRIRSFGCPIDSEARRLVNVAIFFTLVIPLVVIPLVIAVFEVTSRGTGSGKGLGIILMSMIVAISFSCSIIALGIRRPSKLL